MTDNQQFFDFYKDLPKTMVRNYDTALSLTAATLAIGAVFVMGFCVASNRREDEKTKWTDKVVPINPKGINKWTL